MRWGWVCDAGAAYVFRYKAGPCKLKASDAGTYSDVCRLAKRRNILIPIILRRQPAFIEVARGVAPGGWYRS